MSEALTGTMRVMGQRVQGVDSVHFVFDFEHKSPYTFFPGAEYDVVLRQRPDMHAMRQIRLYHWREVCRLSDSLCSGRGLPDSRKNWTALHSMHMKAVQSLNDLFPMGDTAERDAA